MSLFVWTDLSITILGITKGIGTEGNPFYAPFTEAGVTAMVIGVIVYFSIILVWFSVTPGWVRAMTAGFLTAVHIFGTLSWVRFWFPEVDVVFGTFVFMVIATLSGSLFSVLFLLDIKTCEPFQNNDLILYR
jgi:hypothetical protein